MSVLDRIADACKDVPCRADPETAGDAKEIVVSDSGEPAANGKLVDPGMGAPRADGVESRSR